MEEFSCEVDAATVAPIKDMDNSKKQEKCLVEGAQIRCLDKDVQLCPPTSEERICMQGTSDVKVGSFYEIDHSNLPPKSPDQLKYTRVVMVCAKEHLQVSLRYPSLHSLRTHFSYQICMMPERKKIPALDEKYVMGSEHACKTLFRRVPTEEFAERRNSWSFWIATSEQRERDKSPAFCDEATNLVSKKGSCWSQLKSTGMMQWGMQRQVRFLARHEEHKSDSLPASVQVTETGVAEKENKDEERTEKKRKKVDEKEAGKAVPCEVRGTCSRRDQNHSREVQKSKKEKHEKQKQLAVYNKKKRKISIDRWSAERYKAAEENMLKVMKDKGAVLGNPILRPALRSEARKLIGDTGLLDHLLKHMAGKVAPGGTLRFRRRHNAEGAMEYWLESADLVNIRREAGVQDPYWTPPAGWKPGDNPSQHPICASEFRELKEELAKLKENMQDQVLYREIKEELAKLKEDMQELVSKKQEESLAIMITPKSCFSGLNLDEDDSPVPTQDKYIELVYKKAKFEEQLKEISQSLSGLEVKRNEIGFALKRQLMQEQMEKLKSRTEDPIMSELTPPALLPASINSKTKEKENRDKERKSSEKPFHEAATRPKILDKTARIERLKSGFQICRPQGSFIWPGMDKSPQFVVQVDDHIVVPTPPSASSSTTSAPQPQHMPSPPNSPVKPRAERRPVSTATLTQVTAMPFPPPLSDPLKGTPWPKVKGPEIEKPPLINLNEAPPQISDTSFRRTLTYQRARST